MLLNSACGSILHWGTGHGLLCLNTCSVIFIRDGQLFQSRQVSTRDVGLLCLNTCSLIFIRDGQLFQSRQVSTRDVKLTIHPQLYMDVQFVLSIICNVHCMMEIVLGLIYRFFHTKSPETICVHGWPGTNCPRSNTEKRRPTCIRF